MVRVNSKRKRSAGYKGTRIIDGKRYRLWDRYDKAGADKVAEHFRSGGFSARVIKSPIYGDYEVWVRGISFKERKGGRGNG